MIYASIDTETTGLKVTDKVISFGYLALNTDPDEKTVEVITYQDLYFETDVRISPRAQEVHGISHTMLKELADGNKPYKLASIIQQLLSKPDRLIGYNIQFDLHKIEHTFALDIHKLSPAIDVMDMVVKKYGKRVTLENLTKNKNYEKDFDREGFVTKMDGYHSALFDAYVTARYYFEERGYQWILRSTEG